MHIKVKAVPRSDFEELKKIGEFEYIAYIKEEAKNNIANQRLINMLAKEFGISYRKIKIKNPKARDKMVEII